MFIKHPIKETNNFIRGFKTGIKNGISEIKLLFKISTNWCKDTWITNKDKGFKFIIHNGLRQ